MHWVYTVTTFLSHSDRLKSSYNNVCTIHGEVDMICQIDAFKHSKFCHL